MLRPIHFEILADDPEKSIEFYKSVFNWEIGASPDSEQAYWPIKTGEDETPGINGGIMKRHFQQAVINTVAVEFLDEMLEKVHDAGGTTVHGPNEVPGVGNHVYCADPEGNLFGMMQAFTPG